MISLKPLIVAAACALPLAAFAQGTPPSSPNVKPAAAPRTGGRSADGLGCSFSVAQAASPAARCAAIRRQCGGKFHAAHCGDKLLSAM